MYLSSTRTQVQIGNNNNKRKEINVGKNNTGSRIKQNRVRDDSICPRMIKTNLRSPARMAGSLSDFDFWVSPFAVLYGRLIIRLRLLGISVRRPGWPAHYPITTSNRAGRPNACFASFRPYRSAGGLGSRPPHSPRSGRRRQSICRLRSKKRPGRPSFFRLFVFFRPRTNGIRNTENAG